MPTAWDRLDRYDIGPRPDWIKKDQKIETLNGELRAVIAEVEERGDECRVWLSWDDPTAPHGPQAWTIDGLYEYWRPVEKEIA
jgi:hypothetical protein